MKLTHSIILLSAMGLWGGNSLAIDPETENDKIIYSLGYELGKDLKRQNLTLTPDVLLQGVNDAISGNRPLVDAQHRKAAMKQIKQQRAQENLEKSQAFHAKNATKEGVVTLDSGLQYKVLQSGEGKTPGADDSVVAHYRGTLLDGTEFDSSYKRNKPSTFQLGKVIKGWTEALQLMKEGDKWELYVPPQLAYGERGRAKKIPPNSTLIFEVELISVK